MEPVAYSARKLLLVALLTGIVTALVAGLLVSIIQRKVEARNPYVRLVEVYETTTDPAEWGKNWAYQYNGYLRTADATRTRFGGSEAFPEQKAARDPWLKIMFAGYAFALDYRDRRGHAYMLKDQEETERVLKRPQPGACLHCHSSVVPTYRRVGLQALGQPPAPLDTDFNWPAVMKGFEVMSTMNYVEAHGELLKTPDGRTNPPPPAPTAGEPAPTTQAKLAAQTGRAHPVACVDCHDPRSMELRVTRPAFVIGIQALANSADPVPHLPSIQRWREGGKKEAYDVNTMASRQEMRSFVCGQCHVEYYCGPKVTMFYPWANGLKAEQIEAYYDQYKFPDGQRFFDWVHADTGAEVLKAQHPEFELWSQGIHARSGVSCADCHMPYTRQGAVKVSDHWIRSPLLNVNRACQQCHHYPESEILARVDVIQTRNYDLLNRGGAALVDLIEAIKTARAAGASAAQLAPARELQRKAQWRLDFVAAENSMGFHAPQETARILGEAADFARQGELAILRLGLPTTRPARP
jgi:nitrite reductase (cytochrome c-552)